MLCVSRLFGKCTSTRIKATQCFMLVIVVASVSLSSVSALSMEPKLTQVVKNGKVNVSCKADVHQNECFFNILIIQDNKIIANDIIDNANLSRHNFVKNSEHRTELYTAESFKKYGGISECGMSLTVKNFDVQYLVGCRIRTGKDKAWEYEHMTIFVHENISNKKTLLDNNATQTVLPGGNITFLYNFDGHNLTNCSLQGKSFSMVNHKHDNTVYNTRGSAKKTSEGTEVWGQKILENGECKITINNIAANMSGLLWPSAVSYTNGCFVNYSMNPTMMVVGSPPNSVHLSQDETKDNSLTVKCIVKHSRPVANITWLLGNEIIEADIVDDASDDDAWMWPWVPVSITRAVTRKLNEVQGKELRCRVQHMALKGVYVSKSIFPDGGHSGMPATKTEGKTLQNGGGNVMLTKSKRGNEPDDRQTCGCSIYRILFGVTAALLLLILIAFLWYAKIRKFIKFQAKTPQRLTCIEENDVYGLCQPNENSVQTRRGTANELHQEEKQTDICVKPEADIEPRQSIYTESPYAEISMSMWPEGPKEDQ